MNHHPSSLDCWTRNGYRCDSAMTPTSPRSSYRQTFPLIPAWRGALHFSNDPVKSADFRFWHLTDIPVALSNVRFRG
jgi:hypothetical protein